MRSRDRSGRPAAARCARLAMAACACVHGPGVQAAQIDVGDPDVNLRWDNTVKYSNAFRLGPRSSIVMADARTDDGDRNFAPGLVSNRLDLLSELDVSYKGFGARASEAAWYDSVYNESNDNDSPATSNNIHEPYNRFSAATRDRMGRKAELLDAFVFAKGMVGDMSGTIRFGRHTLIFGESLFFGANGIANAQGPVDLVKLLSVPSSQFKEVLRPVEQVSGQLQITPKLSANAYYQLKWDRSVIPPVGSYLSTSDIAGEGAESAGPFIRGRDIVPRNSGQGGLQLRYRTDFDFEFGLFGARYSDKSPNIYLTLDPTTFAPANLVQVYAQDITTFGASFSTTVGSWNIAGESSVRNNTPLVSDPQVVVAGAADNLHDPAYAVGRTAHAQVSAVYLLQTTPLWQGGVFLAELAANRRLSISRNPAAMDPNTTRDALALRMVLSPTYYQVWSGVDLSVPIGLGYNPAGRSSAVFAFNGGVAHGGDFSLGLTATCNETWELGMNLVTYFGHTESFLVPPNSNTAFLSFGQALHDRDFASFYVKHTF